MSGTAALAALLARLERDDRRDEELREEIERNSAHARLRHRLEVWGEYQRECFDGAGIDYGRPRVVGNAPGSKEPAPEWYISLVTAISLLPWDDQQALRWCYVVEDGGKAGRAFEALLSMGMGEK